MPLKTETVRYGANSQHAGYAAVVAQAPVAYGAPTPKTPPLPAVIVLQEAWGVDEHIQDVCARLARAGYYALAPDLFAEDGVRPAPLHRPRMQGVVALVNKHGPSMFRNLPAREAALAELKEPVRSEVTESFAAMSAFLDAGSATYVPAVREAVRYLREDNELTKGRPVAAVGFCFGGSIAGRLACVEPALAGSVVFYGAPPPAEDLANVACPMLALHGALDAPLIPQLPALREAAQTHGKQVEVVVYDDTPHAFFNDARPQWTASAARDAWARTLSFLRACTEAA